MSLLRRNEDMESAQKLILCVLDTATHTFKPGNPKAASIIELREINERNICEETLNSETGSIGNSIASSSSTPPPAAVEDSLEIPILIPRVVIDCTSPESNIAKSPLTRYRYVYNSEKSWSEELVLVEWRLRNHSLRNTFDEEAQAKRYSYFVRLLQRTSRIDPGLCMLPCLGYSLATGQLPDGKKCPIVGYVFKFPKHANSTARLLTLDDKIASCPGILASPSPNLESRFRLSQKLTLALLQLHIAGWKHRQLSSSNIIFFRNEGDQWDDLSKPYISAWQCLSDDYRMQGDNTDIEMKSIRFWKGEDLKSLAVILMQIGLWEYPYNAYHRLSNSNLPGVSMDYRGPFSLQHVQSLYRVLGARLRAKMGSHYAKSV
ncbi:uncharacterized protein BO88DRAFT_430294 [Aspergillus vadensis CBS 113365]|uniref:DUF7580 domain-containing protein n=1 Tax=Aspergillus vadensis (strain CBS 113365 / IMI 142717 / IBT 24658) TaxID=1448311 RepID=A0A319C4A6_ASPVC|nr:hypothetical protein BO88DRAFT_430294 [Aspergillus vadensis CBS 113365]PYH63642.1 hypothetical protein BO88DRAFT_430294 [Aspergillus vadensis CBS 113365]